MKLKVCGMKYEKNIEAIASLEPDFLGFIFYKKSSRYFDDVMPSLPSTIKKVGVFVDAPIEDVLDKIDRFGLHMVQLHGNESPEYCAELYKAAIEVIKVFSIKEDFNFNFLNPFELVCDYYLFDTKGKLPGGNGYSFNWDILKDYPSAKPYFLSGGIGLESLSLLKTFKKQPASKYCYAIDVNSKFEIKPGLKEIEKLKKLKTVL